MVGDEMEEGLLPQRGLFSYERKIKRKTWFNEGILKKSFCQTADVTGTNMTYNSIEDVKKIFFGKKKTCRERSLSNMYKHRPCREEAQ